MPESYIRPPYDSKRPIIIPGSIAQGLYVEMREDIENFVTYIINQKDEDGNKLVTDLWTDNIDEYMKGLDTRYINGENRSGIVLSLGGVYDTDKSRADYDFDPKGIWTSDLEGNLTNVADPDTISYNKYDVGYYGKFLPWMKDTTGMSDDEIYDAEQDYYNRVNQYNVNNDWLDSLMDGYEAPRISNYDRESMFSTLVHEFAHGVPGGSEYYLPTTDKYGNLIYPQARYGGFAGNMAGGSKFDQKATLGHSEIVTINDEEKEITRRGLSQDDFEQAEISTFMKAFDKNEDGTVDDDEIKALGGRKFFNQMSDWINVARPLDEFKGLNFVDRILDPSLNIGREVIDDKGRPMSHFMGSAEFSEPNYTIDEGKTKVKGRKHYIVYPNVVEKTTEFNNYFGLEDIGSVQFHYFKDDEDAKDYAIDTWQYIEFTTDDDAKWFAKNYKKYWDLEGINPYK